MAQKKIEFTKSTTGIGYAYLKGQVGAFSPAFADEMIELGYAREVPVVKKKNEIPPDFPGYRALKESGFVDMDELKRIGSVDQLMEIKGIGRATAEQIFKRL